MVKAGEMLGVDEQAAGVVGSGGLLPEKYHILTSAWHKQSCNLSRII
jgi:hypothetical protein